MQNFKQAPLSAMMDATNKSKASDGGIYFSEYVKGMNHPTTVCCWAWHAYADGVDAGVREWQTPTKWWKRFKRFLKQINTTTKGHPDIWLSEQGVLFSKYGSPEPGHDPDRAMRIMRAYVADGTRQLTRQSGQIVRSITTNCVESRRTAVERSVRPLRCRCSECCPTGLAASCVPQNTLEPRRTRFVQGGAPTRRDPRAQSRRPTRATGSAGRCWIVVPIYLRLRKLSNGAV